ncbi:MAG: 30S ribosomal protein S6 [Planctomycetota bacterium]|jgi:small subunit ribosomal protein S6
MDQRKNYEGMFLLDAGSSDFEAATEPVRKVLARSEAEVLAFKPWDERKLAYEITGRKRGLYVLSYFKADPTRINEIEHDCQLDERILRVLIIRKDSLSDEEVNADTPATVSARKAAERRAVKAAEQDEPSPAAEETDEKAEALKPDEAVDEAEQQEENTEEDESDSDEGDEK